METLQRTSSPSSEQQVEVTTTVQTPLWSLQMALKQHRALPGSTNEPSEPTPEQHHATSPPPRLPFFRTPAATHTSARAVLPRRPKRRQCRSPCGRSRWRSNNTAPFQGQRMNRPSPPESTTVRAHPRAHHATLSPPRSPRRAATPLALEHTLQRCAPPPPRDASIRRLRMNNTRVHLVHDRRPHEARDADQPFRLRCLSSCHCSLCLPRASFTCETVRSTLGP